MTGRAVYPSPAASARRPGTYAQAPPFGATGRPDRCARKRLTRTGRRSAPSVPPVPVCRRLEGVSVRQQRAATAPAPGAALDLRITMRAACRCRWRMRRPSCRVRSCVLCVPIRVGRLFRGGLRDDAGDGRAPFVVCRHCPSLSAQQGDAVRLSARPLPQPFRRVRVAVLPSAAASSVAVWGQDRPQAGRVCTSTPLRVARRSPSPWGLRGRAAVASTFRLRRCLCLPPGGTSRVTPRWDY